MHQPSDYLIPQIAKISLLLVPEVSSPNIFYLISSSFKVNRFVFNLLQILTKPLHTNFRFLKILILILKVLIIYFGFYGGALPFIRLLLAPVQINFLYALLCFAPRSFIIIWKFFKIKCLFYIYLQVIFIFAKTMMNTRFFHNKNLIFF